MTVYLVKFLPKYHVYRIYVVSANPTHASSEGFTSVLINRVGQNRIYTPYMTVCMVISLPKIPYIYRAYHKPINVWFWPTLIIGAEGWPMGFGSANITQGELLTPSQRDLAAGLSTAPFTQGGGKLQEVRTAVVCVSGYARVCMYTRVCVCVCVCSCVCM
jgi:hypothetical protein